jgi:hypothetical protein
MFQPITRPSSGETNTKYAKDDHIKMKEVALTLKVVCYCITLVSCTANKNSNLSMLKSMYQVFRVNKFGVFIVF